MERHTHVTQGDIFYPYVQERNGKTATCDSVTWATE